MNCQHSARRIRKFIALGALAAALVFPAAASADPAENRAVAARIFTEKMGQGRFDRLHEIYGPRLRRPRHLHPGAG